MTKRRLESRAWVVLVLNALYACAEALCSVFVSVYLYKQNLDFQVVCEHYLALYIVTPCSFLLAGWFAQAWDRVYVYRLGLAMHAVYYGLLLYLGPTAPDYAIYLGVLLGVTWGFFWAGSNTFNFDVTRQARREYFLGWLSAVVGVARLVAPLLSGFLIWYSPTEDRGYQIIFAVAVVIYGLAIVASFGVPHDRTPRPFRIWRALFPGKDQRDWQWIMIASASQAGIYHIFTFLLGLAMYMQTGNEMAVGSFLALQAVAGIVAAFVAGRYVVPANRKTSMRWGVALLVLAGALVAWKLDPLTLTIFGFLRAVASPLFSIPNTGIRMDVIEQCAEEPAQRIEYLAAWEVPLATGRIVTITALMILSGWLMHSDFAIRAVLFLLCANRVVTYFFITRISFMRRI
jgi:MFS transporter, YQGE family, putative transporter